MAYEQVKADKPKSPELAKTLAKLLKYEQAPNIAELLDDDELVKIGYDVEREFKIDKASRSDWEVSAERAMDIALQVRTPKNYPFEKAANIKYPLVTVAALQFGARAYPAIVDGNRIVKCQINGSDDGVPQTNQETKDPLIDPMNNEPVWLVPPGTKRAKAERVSRHMSYQLMNEMTEWEEDTDVLLHHLPIIGCAFRKVYRSEELGRNKSEMVGALSLVVNNKCRSLDEAPRVTHILYIYPHDLEDRKRSGTFLDIELPAPTPNTENGAASGDDDAPHEFLEQHRLLDLDEDGYREPYIVTVHKDSCKVVRIVANYDLDKVKDNGKRIIRIAKEQYFVKYTFIPDPKGGFYGIGFGKLLESLSETIDTTINQMLDAGHLQNAGGGFISTGIRLKKNKITVSPGKYEYVEANGPLNASIYNHQYAGPSAVLFNLLGMMVEAAKDITATKDILTGDSGGKVQTATTTLALIEQGLKVFTAIYKRVYRALKDEFKLLFDLNAKYLDQKAYFQFNDQQEVVEKKDYDPGSMDICPLADPSMVTDMQRQARVQILMQISENPVLGRFQDGQEVLARIYDVAKIEDADKLKVKQQGPSPGEQLQLAEGAAKVNEANAGAGLKQAQTQKVAMETQLLPADKMLEAQHHDSDSAHKNMDRTLAVVQAADASAHQQADREAQAQLAQQAAQQKQTEAA